MNKNNLYRLHFKTVMAGSITNQYSKSPRSNLSSCLTHKTNKQEGNKTKQNKQTNRQQINKQKINKIPANSLAYFMLGEEGHEGRALKLLCILYIIIWMVWVGAFLQYNRVM